MPRKLLLVLAKGSASCTPYVVLVLLLLCTATQKELQVSEQNHTNPQDSGMNIRSRQSGRIRRFASSVNGTSPQAAQAAYGSQAAALDAAGLAPLTATVWHSSET